ncbi:MAG: DUF2834 domain-containing protein [Gaiellaceae bacterium]
MVRVYAVLCILGAAFPLAFLGRFVADEGVDVGAFFDQLTATDIGLFAWADVEVSALAVIALALRERSRRLRSWWLAVAATLALGVSVGLPLLLLLRERNLRMA